MNKSKTESSSSLKSEGKSNATITTGSSSSLSSNKHKNTWDNQANNTNAIPMVIETFKGANSELKGKVFIVVLSIVTIVIIAA